MVLSDFHVPYKENSYQGIFRELSLQIKENNISKRGFVFCLCSSNQQTYPVNINDILLTKKGHSWWSSDDTDPNPWFTIDFGLFRVLLEGYAYFTNYVDTIPQWQVWGSLDGNEWIKIHDATPPENLSFANNYFNKQTPLTLIRSIMLKVPNLPSGRRLAIYDFDLFGKLIIPKYLQGTCIHKNNLQFLILELFFFFGS